jgi:ferrous iron transport protein B
MLTEALGTTHITEALSLAQLLTFTIFVLFYIPCAATIAALSREIGWKGAAVAVVSTLVLATGLALLARAFATLVF